MRKEFLWVEKYRPKTIQETILPEKLKQTLINIVKSGDTPNYILSGPKGSGKTTVAMALGEQLGYTVMFINASLDANMDAIRNQIKPFASTVSLNSSRKLVILDEADGIPIGSQAPLKGLIEEFSRNCAFILTVNNINKLITPLHSRCPVINFSINKEERKDLSMQFLKRLMFILDIEKIPYDKKVLAELVTRQFPDFRRIIGEVQTYSLAGKIDSGILADFADIKLADLIKYMKSKDFNKMSDWVASNGNNDATVLFREIYEAFQPSMEKESIPQFILTLADYMYKANFVSDNEINLRACLTQVMADCKFT